jgi:crotonobetainyl-CoA:carnitine CoA-transferase CaiB-like acyl-CoA transferase
VNVASSYLISGVEPQRYGNAHPTVVPYQPFETRDGSFALAVGNDAQFRTLCRALGPPDLAGDSRFSTNAAQVKLRAALVEELEPRFPEYASAHWVTLISDACIPAGPINTLPDSCAIHMWPPAI